MILRVCSIFFPLNNAWRPVPILYSRTNMKVKSITVRVTRKYLEYKDLRISFCDLNRLTKLAGKKVRVGSKNKLSTRSWSGYWLLKVSVGNSKENLPAQTGVLLQKSCLTRALNSDIVIAWLELQTIERQKLMKEIISIKNDTLTVDSLTGGLFYIGLKVGNDRYYLSALGRNGIANWAFIRNEKCYFTCAGAQDTPLKTYLHLVLEDSRCRLFNFDSPQDLFYWLDY